MAITGYYYLHANGEVIFRPIQPGLMDDFENSDLVRCYWPFDATDRRGAWRILIEATASGATRERIADLAKQWQCTDADAKIYARKEGIDLINVNGEYRAVLDGQTGRAYTALGAFVSLYKQRVGVNHAWL